MPPLTVKSPVVARMPARLGPLSVTGAESVFEPDRLRSMLMLSPLLASSVMLSPTLMFPCSVNAVPVPEMTLPLPVPVAPRAKALVTARVPPPLTAVVPV